MLQFRSMKDMVDLMIDMHMTGAVPSDAKLVEVEWKLIKNEIGTDEPDGSQDNFFEVAYDNERYHVRVILARSPDDAIAANYSRAHNRAMFDCYWDLINDYVFGLEEERVDEDNIHEHPSVHRHIQHLAKRIYERWKPHYPGMSRLRIGTEFDTTLNR